MILLDTHVWIWWVHDPSRLKRTAIDFLAGREGEGLGVSLFSCWEVAKLVEYGKLEFPVPLEEWFPSALADSDIELVALTPSIVLTSTRLPGPFHRDPADQLIVATAIAMDLVLATMDDKILAYPHVRTWDV